MTPEEELAQAYEQLTVVQARCSELLESRRAIFAALTPSLANVVMGIVEERRRQDIKWGPIGVKDVALPDGTRQSHGGEANRLRDACNDAAADGTLTWRHILEEEVAEAFAETDSYALRKELIQVAAVCVKWCQCIDERKP